MEHMHVRHSVQVRYFRYSWFVQCANFVCCCTMLPPSPHTTHTRKILGFVSSLSVHDVHPSNAELLGMCCRITPHLVPIVTRVIRPAGPATATTSRPSDTPTGGAAIRLAPALLDAHLAHTHMHARFTPPTTLLRHTQDPRNNPAQRRRTVNLEPPTTFLAWHKFQVLVRRAGVQPGQRH